MVHGSLVLVRCSLARSGMGCDRNYSINLYPGYTNNGSPVFEGVEQALRCCDLNLAPIDDRPGDGIVTGYVQAIVFAVRVESVDVIIFDVMDCAQITIPVASIEYEMRYGGWVRTNRRPVVRSRRRRIITYRHSQPSR